MIDKELDGRGGGYGKFSGMTVAELSEFFQKCESDSGMRAVSAILRVSREQVMARGQLGYYPVYAGVSVLAFAVSFVVIPFLPAALQSEAPKFQMACGFVAFALVAGVLLNSKDRRASVAQERAIRALTAASLARVVSAPDFLAKPLDYTQQMTLRDVLKGQKGHPAWKLLES